MRVETHRVVELSGIVLEVLKRAGYRAVLLIWLHGFEADVSKTDVGLQGLPIGSDVTDLQLEVENLHNKSNPDLKMGDYRDNGAAITGAAASSVFHHHRLHAITCLENENKRSCKHRLVSTAQHASVIG